MTHEESVVIVENAIAVLMEHLDAVQIMGSWLDEGETAFISLGAGNWFAREGQVRRWLCDQDDSRLAGSIGEAMDDDERDGDDWKQEAE